MFEIPDALSVGALLLPLKILIFILIAAVSLLFIRWLCSRLTLPFQEWLNIFVNGALTYVLVWKFSSILTNFSRVLEQPSIILFATGGSLGHFLGLLGALAIILYSLKKRKIGLFTFFDLFSVWAISTLTVFWVVQRTYGLPTAMPWGIKIKNANPLAEAIDVSQIAYHPIFLYQFLLGAFLLLYILSIKDKLLTGVVTIHSLFLFGSGLLLISLFVYQPSTLLLGLSASQLGYLLMSVIGLLGTLFYKPVTKPNTQKPESNPS